MNVIGISQILVETVLKLVVDIEPMKNIIFKHLKEDYYTCNLNLQIEIKLMILTIWRHVGATWKA